MYVCVYVCACPCPCPVNGCVRNRILPYFVVCQKNSTHPQVATYYLVRKYAGLNASYSLDVARIRVLF